MAMKRTLGAVLVAAVCLAFASPALPAEEQKFELKPSATVKEVLQESLGKRVIVRVESGETLEGTVMKVGDTLVHLAKLSGRDFYDAVVRIDRISAVVFRARS